MTWFRAGGGGIPASLKNGMNAVLNKKFGTSGQTYDPSDWPDDVNLLGKLPEKTVSGTIVTFSDGADAVPLKKCEITLPASLDGYSSVDVVHCGGNILETNAQSKTQNGITWTVNADGSVTLEGTSTARTYLYVHGYHKIMPKDATLTVSVEGLKDNGTNDVFVNLPYSNDGTTYGGTYGQCTWNNPTKTINYTADKYIGFYIDCPSGATTNQTIKVMVSVGSSSLDFEPYTAPTTHTADLGRTIYGGTADVVNGTGTETYKKVVFDGTEQWQKSGSALNGYYTPMPTQGLQTYTAVLCNKATMASSSSDYYNNYDKCYVDYYFAINLDPDVVGNTVAQFKQWLADQYAGGTPLFIVGKQETDTDFTFDPVSIDSKLGNNTIWSEQGSIEVTYRADIDLVLAQLSGTRSLMMASRSVSPMIGEEASLDRENILEEMSENSDNEESEEER